MFFGLRPPYSTLRQIWVAGKLSALAISFIFNNRECPTKRSHLHEWYTKSPFLPFFIFNSFQSFTLFFLLYMPQFFSPTHILAFNAISSGNIRTIGADLVTTIMFRDIGESFIDFLLQFRKHCHEQSCDRNKKGKHISHLPDCPELGFIYFLWIHGF